MKILYCKLIGKMSLDSIIPFLFICDETTARDFKLLTDSKIKGIISLTGEIAFPNSIFKYFNLEINNFTNISVHSIN